ncbi:response regulator [Tautonia sociabilis]|uniref:Response regulator n=1 Tax=Tautonia sociabilis TaxID=2080755 RepID=A0A432ML08_9BACT|nr:response regulator [Tautonia sociabilis]RUL88092.1 response regulator [Tautonia sociabilis]
MSEARLAVPPRQKNPSPLLVVDDQVVDRRVICHHAERLSGLPVIGCGGGREALEEIARHRPSAVLTDMSMPDMDGLELIEILRERYPGLPVIVLTAHGSEELAARALRVGAASYVPKRLLNSELGEALRTVLKLARASRTLDLLLTHLERWEKHFLIPNDPTLLPPLVDHLTRDLDAAGGCDGTGRLQVGIALQEALSNALYHGNLEVSSDLRQEGNEERFHELARERAGCWPFASRRIEVEAKVDRTRAWYSIRDEGPGFDVSRLNRPPDPEDLLRVGGRGLMLIRAFMDEVRYNECGNAVTMVKHLAGPSGRGQPEDFVPGQGAMVEAEVGEPAAERSVRA